jgi:hypothetical protein
MDARHAAKVSRARWVVGQERQRRLAGLAGATAHLHDLPATKSPEFGPIDRIRNPSSSPRSFGRFHRYEGRDHVPEISSEIDLQMRSRETGQRTSGGGAAVGRIQRAR